MKAYYIIILLAATAFGPGTHAQNPPPAPPSTADYPLPTFPAQPMQTDVPQAQPPVTSNIQAPPAAPLPIAPPTLAAPPRPLNTVWTWVNMDDYPPIAIRFGLEGRTQTMLDVDRDGRVTQCQVTQSSGAQMLDDAACRSITRRARFTPASDAKGNRVPGTHSRGVQWRIPDSANPVKSLAPTPRGNPAAWVMINGWMDDKRIVRPKGAEIINRQRLYRLTVNDLGKVQTCAVDNYYVGLRVMGFGRRDAEALDAEICVQYTDFAQFALAYDDAKGRLIGGDYIAHIPVKEVVVPQKR